MPTPMIIDDHFSKRERDLALTRRLFDERSVAIATLLGSTLAGGALMYYNARQLGRGDGPKHLAVAFAIAAGVIALAFVLPASIPGIGYSIAQLLALRAYYMSTQHPAVAAHAEAGGVIGSRWLAAGVGLVGLVVMGGLILVVVLATTDGPLVAF